MSDKWLQSLVLIAQKACDRSAAQPETFSYSDTVSFGSIITFSEREGKTNSVFYQ